MDDVFKALADPTRRRLLDTLRDRGGLTLTELEVGLGMTRFGVMKHLKVLEDANLIVTRRDGRFKHHYLNALPIQEVADRWMAPYGKPLVRFALDLKNSLENPVPMADRPDFVLQTYIRTTQQALWDALTKGEITQQYYYGGRLETNLKKGGPFRYIGPDGKVLLGGEIVEIDPISRLVSTFLPGWTGKAQPTLVTFELVTVGEAVKFTITHHDVAKTADAGVVDGWPVVVAGLKTLLETGKPLVLPSM
ncbi:MAG: metalloregulator ArsR/SmtB family transcription factor [Devosia sp.]